MRVVAGAYKGRRLRAPRGHRTRPTADMVREALFSMLGGLEGASVLDLYAGSGALGIEALSRGATAATFVERDPRALAAIRRNLETVGADGQLFREDVLRFLERAEGRHEVILCDPPYDAAARLGAPLSERLPGVLSQDGLIVTESDKRSPLELDLPLIRERSYGDTRIAIHRGEPA